MTVPCCKYDTDGDGNCHIHKDGIPTYVVIRRDQAGEHTIPLTERELKAVVSALEYVNRSGGVRPYETTSALKKFTALGVGKVWIRRVLDRYGRK